MIQLVLHMHSGIRATLRFNGMTEYTNWLIFHPEQMNSPELSHFEVNEIAGVVTCENHADWYRMSRTDHQSWQFACATCRTVVEITAAQLNTIAQGGYS